MKASIIVSIAALSLTTAGSSNTHRLSDYPSITKDDEPSLTINDFSGIHNPKMWACNTIMYINETIVLRFKTPNAPFLGIVDPQGHFFYLVFPSEDAIGNLIPFVGSKCFENLSELKINTTALHGDPYTYDVYDNQPVFTQSGVYTFIMGENLHIDNPGFLEKVEVAYIHAHRRNQSYETIAIK